RLPLQDGAQAVQARPAVLGPAHGQVVEHELAGNEDALGEGRLQQAADLVGDAVLEAAGVAGVGRADRAGLLPREPGVELGGDGVDGAPGLLQESLSLGLDLAPAARALAAGGWPASARDHETERVAWPLNGGRRGGR